MTFTVDLQEHFMNDYESVAMIGTKFIVNFGPQNFAPGVWAGTEGFELKYNNMRFRIVKIDFDRRLLECVRAYDA